MGQMELTTALKGVSEPNKSLFEFIEIIGVGGYGSVWKVKYKKTKQILALKELSKKILLESNLISSTFKERDILCSLYSPYITNLYCTFQDKYNLYIVLDYLPGKDLRDKMTKKKKM
jgi:serine/threonine protein kinase